MLKSVSPSEGSTSGGTKITITSEHVVGPASNIAVEVGGNLSTSLSHSRQEIKDDIMLYI